MTYCNVSVCGDLSTENNTKLVNINEVTKEDGDPNIIECLAEQVENTEAEQQFLAVLDLIVT